MKFLFSVDGWYLGGFVTFCRNLSRGLKEQGHQVQLLIQPEARLRRSLHGEPFDECRVLARRLGPTWSHIKRVAWVIKQMKPDVLVLHNSPYSMAALPFLDPGILRIPVLHNIEPTEVDVATSNGAWWDELVVVSDYVGATARPKTDASRVSRCFCGVPVPAQRGPYPRPALGPLRLISVSRVVVRQKRMDRVPAIARLLEQKNVDYHWTILGDGEYLSELRSRLVRDGLSHRFSLRGSVPDHEVNRAFTESDLFVMVSDYEGLPQALLEAMAQGVTPVVSRIPDSTTCVVTPGTCGFLCEPSALDQFAGVIARLAVDRLELQATGQRAADRVRAEFSIEVFAKRFLAIVEKAHAHADARPRPLLPGAHVFAGVPLGCLGFWRTLRHQTLGQAKRWFLKKRYAIRTPSGALPPTVG